MLSFREAHAHIVQAIQDEAVLGEAVFAFLDHKTLAPKPFTARDVLALKRIEGRLSYRQVLASIARLINWEKGLVLGNNYTRIVRAGRGRYLIHLERLD